MASKLSYEDFTTLKEFNKAKEILLADGFKNLNYACSMNSVVLSKGNQIKILSYKEKLENKED